MCNHENREAAMVIVDPGTPERNGRDGVWCDPCLEPIVRALNEGGVRTVASCCGHGRSHGNIALADGRELIIMPDFDSARALGSMATRPTDITDGYLPDGSIAPLDVEDLRTLVGIADRVASDELIDHALSLAAKPESADPSPDLQSDQRTVSNSASADIHTNGSAT